ncbi:MAG: hypothetical protein U0074_05255 [Kouleothrix sp.]
MGARATRNLVIGISRDFLIAFSDANRNSARSNRAGAVRRGAAAVWTRRQLFYPPVRKALAEYNFGSKAHYGTWRRFLFTLLAYGLAVFLWLREHVTLLCGITQRACCARLAILAGFIWL